MATLQSIRDQVYLLINENVNSAVFDFNTRVLPKINNVSTQICQGQYKDTITGQMYKSGDLRFLRKKIFIQAKPSSVITGDITPSSTIILTNTTNFSNSGSVYIHGNIISYIGKTTTQLLGCSGIQGFFKAGSEVVQVYMLPTDTDRTFNLFWVNKEGLFEFQYQDLKDQKKYYQGFSIIEDNTQSNNYLYIRGNNQESDYWLYYYSKYTDLVNLTDVSPFPDNIAEEVIAKITAGELLMETEMDQQGTILLRQGYAKLHAFYMTQQHETRHRKVLTKKPMRYY